MTIDTQALYNKAAASCQLDEPVLLSDSSPLGGPGLHSPREALANTPSYTQKRLNCSI